MNIQENISLAPLTTFKIGGPARFFTRVRSIEELRESLDFARDKKLTTFVLGGGSNVLIRDKGFEGLVIKIEITGIEEDGGRLIAGAGEEWDALVSLAVKKNLWGIENLSGIPGTVGAAPVQNIGAYGSELKDTLEFVEAFDISTGASVTFSNEACEFGYRISTFKKNPNRFVITRACVQLRKDGKPNLSYNDLKDLNDPSLFEIREAVLNVRAKKFPDLTKEGTAGSFFLNPVVSLDTAARLKEKYPELPQFPAQNGVKISLAWLLDNVLHLKGMQRGTARLFEKQPLVVVGLNATFEDVESLAQEVVARIQTEFSITIEPEVKIV